MAGVAIGGGTVITAPVPPVVHNSTLTGTGKSASPLGVDTTAIQVRISSACSSGTAIRAIAADGTLTCQSAGDTYTAGSGLTLLTGVFAIDPTYTQRRVGSTCAAGSSIRAIAQDGTVTCETDDSGITNSAPANTIMMSDGTNAVAAPITHNTTFDTVDVTAPGGLTWMGTQVALTTDIGGTTGHSLRLTSPGFTGTGAFTDDGTNATIAGTFGISGNMSTGNALLVRDTDGDAYIQFDGGGVANQAYMRMNDTGQYFSLSLGSPTDNDCTLSNTGVWNCVGGLQVNGTNVALASNITGTVGRSLRMASSGTTGTGAFTDDGTNASLSGTLGVGGTITLNRAAGLPPILSWKQTGQAEWQIYQAPSTDQLRFWNSVTSLDSCTLTTAGVFNCLGGLQVNGANVSTTSTGTINTLPKYTSAGGFGNSSISDDGSGRILFSGDAEFRNNQLNFIPTTDADGTGVINWAGFNNGTTRFRDLTIADGKNGTIASFTGSSKQVDFAGAVTVAGNTTLGDASTDTATVAGYAGFGATPNSTAQIIVDGSGRTYALYVTGAGQFNNNVTVSGNTTVNGDATFNGDVYTGLSTGSTTTKILNIGRDTTLTTNNENGFRFQAFNDGSLYIDHKTITGGTINYRAGAGTETGAARTFMQITPSTRAVLIPGNFSTNGNMTVLGQATFSNTITQTLVSSAFAGDRTATSLTIAGSYDATAAARTTYAVKGINSSTRSSGSNTVTNVGLYGSATNGQDNIGLLVDDGRAQLDGALDVNDDLSKFGGTVDGGVYFAGGATNNNAINFEYGTAALATGWINLRGGSNGAGAFRNLIIADGKTNAIATFTGSSKAVAFAGDITVAGSSTLGDASTDITTIVGKLTANSTTGTDGQVLKVVGGVPKWQDAESSSWASTYFSWSDEYITTNPAAASGPMQGGWEYQGGTCANTWLSNSTGGEIKLLPNATGGTCAYGADGTISHKWVRTASTNTWTAELGADFSDLADGTAGKDYTFIFGLGDSSSVIDQVNGCYFAYDPRNHLTGSTGTLGNQKWECWCAASSTRTKYEMNGSTVSDGSFTTVNAPLTLKVADHLKLVYTDAAVDFYVNGVKSCHITTNIPVTASDLQPVLRMANNSSSSTAYLEMDWSRVTLVTSSARGL